MTIHCAKFAIVQIVQTKWTKKSRGAPVARTRNLVPESAILPLMDKVMPAYTFVWHEVLYDEDFAFNPRDVLRTYSQERQNFHQVDLFVDKTVSTIHITLATDFHAQHLLVLPEHCYGRVVFNYYEDEPSDEWYRRCYYKVCVNAIIGVAVEPDIFVRSSPEREIRALVNLS